LCDRLAAIFLANVFDDVGAAVVREINVDIGRIDALRIQKTLEKETVTNWVDVGDFQQVSDD